MENTLADLNTTSSNNVEDTEVQSRKSKKVEISEPKKSSLLVTLVSLVLAMICGIYMSFICLQQFNLSYSTLNFQASNMPCPRPKLEDWEVNYVHVPKPVTYNREECACHPVRYFVIISTQRSGSGWFETLLNSHMNVSSNGEIFSVKDRKANVSTIIKTLDKVYNLDWFSSASKNECTAAVGLKWMLNQGLMRHHEEMVKYFIKNGVSLIFLFRRNMLRRMISILANTYDREHKLLNGTHISHTHSEHKAAILASYKPEINTTTLISNLKQVQKTRAKALTNFISTRHILLYYEDVVNNCSKLFDVQDFLRVPRRILTSKQVKIHKGNLSEHVANWEAVQKTLNGTEFETFLHAD